MHLHCETKLSFLPFKLVAVMQGHKVIVGPFAVQSQSYSICSNGGIAIKQEGEACFLEHLLSRFGPL